MWLYWLYELCIPAQVELLYILSYFYWPLTPFCKAFINQRKNIYEIFVCLMPLLFYVQLFGFTEAYIVNKWLSEFNTFASSHVWWYCSWTTVPYWFKLSAASRYRTRAQRFWQLERWQKQCIVFIINISWEPISLHCWKDAIQVTFGARLSYFLVWLPKVSKSF